MKKKYKHYKGHTPLSQWQQLRPALALLAGLALAITP